MKKVLLLTLMLGLIMANPFGCKIRRVAHLQRKSFKLDSALHKQGSYQSSDMHFVDSKAVFETLSKEKHTKATYRTEKTTTKEIALDGEYELDSLRPCSGDTLNFVNKEGERAQVIKDKYGALKIKGTQRGRLVEREITEMTLEQSEHQAQSKVDTSSTSIDYAQRHADSLLYLKVTRNEDDKVKAVDKTTTGVPWWGWLLAAGGLGLMLNFKELKKWLNR